MTAPRPWLDIMLPFYGDVGLMQEAVLSVLAQDTDGWHLTVIDDCYPDPAVRRWLAALDDPRVTYLRNPVNLGVGGTFARALEEARAERVTFLGCDDVLLPDYVSRMRGLLDRHPDAAVVQPAVREIDTVGRPVEDLTRRVKRLLTPAAGPVGTLALGGEAAAVGLLRGNWTYFPSLCWDTATARRWGFRSDLTVVVDLALLLSVVLEGSLLVVDGTSPTFLYRRHRQSVSSALATTGHRFDEEAAFFTEVAERCASRGWTRAARAARLHATSRLHAAALLPTAVRRRDPATMRRLLAHALGT